MKVYLVFGTEEYTEGNDVVHENIFYGAYMKREDAYHKKFDIEIVRRTPTCRVTCSVIECEVKEKFTPGEFI